MKRQAPEAVLDGPLSIPRSRVKHPPAAPRTRSADEVDSRGGAPSMPGGNPGVRPTPGAAVVSRLRRHLPLALMVVGMAATLLLVRPLAQGAMPLLDEVRASGLGGAALFCAVYSVATLLLVPTTPFAVLAGALYGPWGGGVLLMVLSLGVDLVAFYLARLGRGPFARLGERFPGLARLDAALGEGGFLAVCLLRLSPLAPYGVLNYALGLTRVGPVAFLAGTAVGSLPATVLFLVLGHGAAGVVQGGGSVGLWVTVALTALSAVGLTAWAKRRMAAPEVAA